MRPAVRIVFKPLFHTASRAERAKGLVVHGRTWKENRTIELDPRSREILDTLVHELAHVRHPGWAEDEVLAHTKAKMKRMGWREKARLLKLLGSAHIEGED